MEHFFLSPTQQNFISLTQWTLDCSLYPPSQHLCNFNFLLHYIFGNIVQVKCLSNIARRQQKWYTSIHLSLMYTENNSTRSDSGILITLRRKRNGVLASLLQNYWDWQEWLLLDLKSQWKGQGRGKGRGIMARWAREWIIQAGWKKKALPVPCSPLPAFIFLSISCSSSLSISISIINLEPLAPSLVGTWPLRISSCGYLHISVQIKHIC